MAKVALEQACLRVVLFFPLQNFPTGCISKAPCSSVIFAPSLYCTCTDGEQFPTASRTRNAPVPKRYPVQPPSLLTGIPVHLLNP